MKSIGSPSSHGDSMSIRILGNTEYPAWRHNKNGESQIVHSKAEDRKLGKAWADTPAAFETDAVEDESDD